MSKVLKILKGVATGRLERKLTCEACGDEFTCGASLSGCWCADVKLSQAATAELRRQYSDCVCPACLKTKGDPAFQDHVSTE